VRAELHDVQTLDLELYVPRKKPPCSATTVVTARRAVDVKGGGHYVALQPPALDAIWSFVQAHPKGG